MSSRSSPHRAGLWLFAAAAALLCGAAPPDAGARIDVTYCDAGFCDDPGLTARYRSITPNLAVDDRPAPAAPKTRPPPLPAGTQLVVKVNQTLPFTPPCAVQRAAFGNYPYDLRFADGLVYVTGLERGRGTLLLWCRDGKRVTYPVDIR